MSTGRSRPILSLTALILSLTFVVSPSRVCAQGAAASSPAASSPATAAPRAPAAMKIAVIPPVTTGKASLGDRRVLREHLHKGLAAAGLDVVNLARRDTTPCGTRCVQRVAHEAHARYVAGAQVKADSPFFELHLWIADGATGKQVATVNTQCDVCPRAALATRMDLSASRLAVALRDRAKKPAVFVVTSTPAGAEVRVDGAVKGTTPLRLALPPGRHALELRADEHFAARRELHAVAAVEERVEVALIPATSPQPSHLRTLGAWSLIGAGAAAIAAGAVLLALDGSDTGCVQTAADGDYCKGTYTTALGGGFLLGGGILAAGGGAALLLWPRGGDNSQETTTAPAGASNTPTPSTPTHPGANARSRRGRFTVQPSGLGLSIRSTF